MRKLAKKIDIEQTNVNKRNGAKHWRTLISYVLDFHFWADDSLKTIMNMSSQGDSFQGDSSQEDSAQEDSSPYFKKPYDISTTSTRVSSSSVAASVYGKSTFFRNQTASNPSTPGPNRGRTSAENKSSTYTSNDFTLAGNKSLPYSTSTSLAKYGSSSNSLASYGSTSTVSDFNINKRKGRNSFDTSSLATPGKEFRTIFYFAYSM